jgi:hypothetical protein
MKYWRSQPGMAAWSCHRENAGAGKTWTLKHRRPDGAGRVRSPADHFSHPADHFSRQGRGGERPSVDVAQWSDAIPKMLLARIVQNAEVIGAVAPPVKRLAADYQPALSGRHQPRSFIHIDILIEDVQQHLVRAAIRDRFPELLAVVDQEIRAA